MRHALLLAAACLAAACTENSRAPAPAAPETRTPAAPPAPSAVAPAPAQPPAAAAGAAVDAGSPPQAQQAAPGPCEREEVVRITPAGTGAKPALQLDPDPGHGKAVRAAEVDLDGRNQPDLHVVFPTDFGSDGATVQALYAHCSGNQYAPVWGPEYTHGLKVQETRTNGWRDVVHSEKAGTPDTPSMKHVPMRLQGDTYRDAPAQ